MTDEAGPSTRAEPVYSVTQRKRGDPTQVINPATLEAAKNKLLHKVSSSGENSVS